MARLRGPDGSPHPLSAHTLLGRGRRCALRLTHPQASSQHAALTWRDGAWRLRDLASSNGTFVDGVRLTPGELRSLTVGAVLTFGHPDEAWTLATVAAPRAVAVRDGDGAWREAEDGMLLLPDDEAPVATVLLDGTSTWIAERLDGCAPVDDGDALELGGDTWRLTLPVGVAATRDASSAAGPLLAEGRLHFTVSRDEEYVELALHGPTGITAVPARAHHYLLLTLARARAADAALPFFEQGWLHHEDVERMLHVDRLGVNTQVLRARRQLSRLGIADGPTIVERRATSGYLRLGVPPERVVVHTP